MKLAELQHRFPIGKEVRVIETSKDDCDKSGRPYIRLGQKGHVVKVYPESRSYPIVVDMHKPTNQLGNLWVFEPHEICRTRKPKNISKHEKTRI